MHESLPLLAVEKPQIVGNIPFNTDLLQREQLAVNLTRYIDRLKMGAVLAIDAPWGEGKTWFGQNWAKKLESDGYRVVHIDAFEQDYMDDPFMLLASELLNMVEDKSQAKMLLTKRAANVAKATVSIGAKISMGLLTKYALGGVDLDEEIEGAISDASKESAKLSSEWIEESFAKHNENKNTIVAFKEELTKYAASQEKPIVIFIDELDRCKPDFAVNLVERIKHFFDVPNVVFVLLLNRDQLQKAIKGVYGVETDASAYLGKFINFFLKLPKHKLGKLDSERTVLRFVSNTFLKYKFPTNKSFKDIQELIATFSMAFNLSLRDIERVVSLYAFAYPMNHLDQILIYIIVLKQYDYSTFQKLIEGDKLAHEKLSKKLSYIINEHEKQGNHINRAFPIMEEWHRAYENDFSDMGDKIGKIYGLMQGISYDILPQDMFSYFSKKIDLEIEN